MKARTIALLPLALGIGSPAGAATAAAGAQPVRVEFTGLQAVEPKRRPSR